MVLTLHMYIYIDINHIFTYVNLIFTISGHVNLSFLVLPQARARAASARALGPAPNPRAPADAAAAAAGGHCAAAAATQRPRRVIFGHGKGIESV